MIQPEEIPQEFNSNPRPDQIAIRIKALNYGCCVSVVPAGREFEH